MPDRPDAAIAHLRRLYEQASREFGTECLWSRRPVRDPGSAHARIIAQALRDNGGSAAHRLGRDLQEACDAVDRASAWSASRDRGKP